MARSLNMVQLIGNLTQDPEVKQIPSGASVATITIATNRAWKDQAGQLQEETEFHNVVLWRGLADIASQYLKKGGKVYVKGYLKTRSWDSQDGTKKYRTEIIGDDMVLLSARREGEGAPMSAGSSASAGSAGGSAPTQQAQQPKTDFGGIQSMPSGEPIQIEDIPF